MTIQIIHVSDIHFGSGESHGRLNAETGLNTRLEDFVAALKKVVDYALDCSADVLLFSGDAYKNATPDPIYQKLFASELHRLSESGIKTILVVGNHDQILRSTSSHSMSVFQSLEVPGVVIVDKPLSLTIDTKNGAFQLIGLPHITRHNVMTLEKYAGCSAAEIDDILVHHVSDLLRSFYDELDTAIPSVVTAHMTVDRALAGIENELLVGYTLTFPTDIFVDDRIDYVGLGHVHKFQIIRSEAPIIAYAGSLERVDFGEEKEDKGFIHVWLERGTTRHQFVSIEPRPFVTIDVDVTAAKDPTAAILKRIAKDALPECVLRVRYKILQEQAASVKETEIFQAAEGCMSVRVQAQVVSPDKRGRIPDLTESSVTAPIRALETYLDEVAPERKQRLIERASDVMAQLNSEFHKDD